MNENLLEHLNESQREAVLYFGGASLIIAGAGSGKTRVLTHKIAYLLKNGINGIEIKPWNVLALTFTNKAAREMRERISMLVGSDMTLKLNMGTFHSVFSRILRAESDKIGYNSNFTIYDQADARSLVKSIIKEMALDENAYKASNVSDVISMAKNYLILPNAFVKSTLFDTRKPKISEIYLRYIERCRKANAMDFDDLLLNTYLLFKNNDAIKKKYAHKFKYILIDEFQDTNIAQYKIILLLAEAQESPFMVCAVGDDAQSIYSFRGANIDNILHFEKEFYGVQRFLVTNYRSTRNIVNAANSLIKANKYQITDKPVIESNNEQGERLTLKPAYSDKEEAMIVCNDIKRIRRQDKCEYSDFAILYRTNSQSRSFEEQMRKDNIPYRIYGGLSFYQRKEIKDVIAYFRLVANPDDEEALKRIINYPTRGIGDTTLSKIVATASSYGVSLWSVICQPTLFHLEIASGTAKKIEAFRQLVEGWMGRMPNEDAYQLGHAIIMESGISKDIYGSRNPEDLSRQENLEEFLSGMQDFVESRREEGLEDQVGISDFLQEVALLTDLDSEGDDNQPKVALMTIHSAKGLEFPTVFVVGLEENIFPSPMCTDSLRALEEERRLLYVAITRAEKHCILTCAQNRFRYGRMEYDTPSRFIRDIDPALLSVQSSKDDAADRDFGTSRLPWTKRSDSPSSSWMQNPRPVASQFRADPKPRQVASVPSSSTSSASSASSTSTLREGMVIEHQRFGIGTVVRLEGTGENAKATVQFRNTGTKQLLLKFAKFKVVT